MWRMINFFSYQERNQYGRYERRVDWILILMVLSGICQVIVAVTI